MKLILYLDGIMKPHGILIEAVGVFTFFLKGRHNYIKKLPRKPTAMATAKSTLMIKTAI